MNTISKMQDVSGKLILPIGVIFLSGALFIISYWLFPATRNYFPQLLTPQYAWIMWVPLVSGVILAGLVLVLWRKA